MRKLLLAAIALLVLSPAYAAEPCLRMDQIWNWKVLNDRTLIVDNYNHQKFKVSLMVHCPNMDFHQRLGFKAFGGSQLSCLSPGDYVIERDSMGPQHCPITKVEAYTPEMQKADEAAAASH